jgi:hypothetical protein
MKIQATITVDVDVFEIEASNEDLARGWYSVIRALGGSADLWLGPYSKKSEAVYAAKRRLSMLQVAK